MIVQVSLLQLYEKAVVLDLPVLDLSIPLYGASPTSLPSLPSHLPCAACFTPS